MKMLFKFSHNVLFIFLCFFDLIYYSNIPMIIFSFIYFYKLALEVLKDKEKSMRLPSVWCNKTDIKSLISP